MASQECSTYWRKMLDVCSVVYEGDGLSHYFRSVLLSVFESSAQVKCNFECVILFSRGPGKGLLGLCCCQPRIKYILGKNFGCSIAYKGDGLLHHVHSIVLSIFGGHPEFSGGLGVRLLGLRHQAWSTTNTVHTGKIHWM